MTPKEKARSLVNKAAKVIDPDTRLDVMKRTTLANAKDLALIAVGTILDGERFLRLPLSYWQQVKEEIEKL